MKPFKNTNILKRSSEIEVRSLDDELILMSENSGNIFNLNPLGAAIWRLLEQPRSLGEIVELLIAAFPDIGKERVEQDVCRLVKKLTETGLVSVQD